MKRAYPLTYINEGDVFYSNADGTGVSRVVRIDYAKGKIWLDKPVGFYPFGDSEFFGIVRAHKGNRHKVVQLI